MNEFKGDREVIKGFKVFNSDWTCRGYQFEVGKTFEEDVKLECCDRGFHFCKQASDCFNYYRFDPNNKVAEVVALGEVDTHSDDSKCSTNKLHIIKEIPWTEVLELVNLGKGNTGLWNSGNCNSGNCNSGDWNSGNCNSGNHNSGDWNSGNCNNGDWNTGYRNTGNWNSGDWNTGNWNVGNYNSGDFNKASRTMGCFNTESQKLKFFDKETNITYKEWHNSDARYLLNQIDFRPIEWISSNDMTEEEKEQYPEHETTGGCLKIRDNTDACIKWWHGLSEKNKNVIRSIPNFDADKFFEITGIRA